MPRRFQWENEDTEPDIETDVNGKMIEDWIPKYSLNHLNLSEDCIGTYTFDSLNGRSAIDHILTNDKLFEGFKGMHIDEERAILNISDHNLVRAWFKIGGPYQWARYQLDLPTLKTGLCKHCVVFICIEHGVIVCFYI